MGTSFSRVYLGEVARIASLIDAESIEHIARRLAGVREGGGRLFIVGAGGGAGNASHAVSDFRKICLLESYTPSDNVSELTAWINDDGWDVAYANWLAESGMETRDALLVFSVGGGSREHSISMSIVKAMELARRVDATVLAIVGKAEGEATRLAHVCVVVPIVAVDRRTPHTEEFQAVLWHLLASHPLLSRRTGTWETIESRSADEAATA